MQHSTKGTNLRMTNNHDVPVSTIFRKLIKLQVFPCRLPNVFNYIKICLHKNIQPFIDCGAFDSFLAIQIGLLCETRDCSIWLPNLIYFYLLVLQTWGRANGEKHFAMLCWIHHVKASEFKFHSNISCPKNMRTKL